MRSESDSMPSAVEVQDGTALVRANIITASRTDEGGKSRIVYQYDEIKVATNSEISADDLIRSAEALVDAASVSESGYVIMPKGAVRMMIPHRLGVAPESISVVPQGTIKGLKVFVSSDRVIITAPPASEDVRVDWAVSGKGRGIVDKETYEPVKVDAAVIAAAVTAKQAAGVLEDKEAVRT